MNGKITRVEVLIELNGTDKVNLYLEAPTPFPKMGFPACATVEVAKGYGIDWAVQFVGANMVPITVINCKTGKTELALGSTRENVSSP
jgi:hypothetical protein